MSITTIAARTPQTTRTIARIIGGYAVDSADVALVLGFLSSQDGATRLRYAVASNMGGCGRGSARHASWMLGVAGIASPDTTDPDALVASWAWAYEQVDKAGAWIDITELSRAAREAAGDAAYQAWRRACCDAFDLVTRRGIGQDARAAAWSYVAARVAVLHLLGATVDETDLAGLCSVVRAWIPETARAEIAA